MPNAPQAKFEFVATGDDQVNAQVQSVINKLVQMKSAATEAGKSSSEGMLSAKEDVMALGEALETHIPRPLAAVISQFQSLQGVLAGAGIAGALTLGVQTAVNLYEKGQEIYDKWLNVDEAVKEYDKTLGDAVVKSAQNVLSIEDAESSLRAATDQVAKFAKARDDLNKHNQKTDVTQDPLDFFLSKSYEKDALTGQLKSSLQVFTDQKNVIEEQSKATDDLISKERQLSDIRLEGLPKILADEQSDIALADAKLARIQQLAAIENQRRTQYNLSHSAADQVPLIPGDVGEQEHATSVYYAQADAFAKIQTAVREAQSAVQSFNDMMENATGDAKAVLEADPYQQDLDKLDDFWTKKIRSTMEGGERELDVLRVLHQNTAALQDQLDNTLLIMWQAYMSQKDKMTVDNEQKLLTAGGTIKSPSLSALSSLTITDDENRDREQAKALIEQITKALQDETAQEQLLKDRAAATGETQIALEAQLLALRGASADKIQGLIDQLKQLATTMHQGIGDPVIMSQADKFGAKLDDLRLKTKTWATDLKKDLSQDMENAFVGIVSMTETTSQAFEKMAQDILSQLAKIIYQMYIVKLLQSALGGIFGSTASTSGSDIGSGLSGVLNGVTPHAMGGPVVPGQTYLVGERGPELFRSGTSGTIVPNSQIGSAGGQMPLQVNIHNYGQPMEQSQTSRFDGEKYVVDIVVKNIQNNGSIRQVMKS